MSAELMIRTRGVLKERWLMAHEHRAFLIRDLAVRVRELEAERKLDGSRMEALAESAIALRRDNEALRSAISSARAALQMPQDALAGERPNGSIPT